MIPLADLPPPQPVAAVEFSVGADARTRFESGSDGSWFNYRLMPYASLKREPLTVYVQGIFARSVSEPGGRSPTESTGFDLLQAYAKVDLPLNGSSKLSVRVGRAVERLGSERLVGARWGTNVPRSFDGAEVEITHDKTDLRIFSLRQVRSGLDSFDNRATSNGTLQGAYLVTPLAKLHSTLDVYLLRTRFTTPRFGASADNRRTTFGLRLAGASNGWQWNWEAIAQRGSAERDEPIRAWSLATETGRRFSIGGHPVTFDLKANIASGGRAGGTLRNFDPLFPKAKYFGELTPIGPANMVNVHPSLTVDVGNATTLGLAGIRYWRLSTKEPAYSLSGGVIPIVGGGSLVGDQAELTIERQFGKGLSALVSLSRFKPSKGAEQGGVLEPTTLVALELNLSL